MKVTPVSTFAATNAQQASTPPQQSNDAMRSIKMITNHTPLPNQQGDPSKLTLSGNSEGSEKPVVEATQPIDPQLARLAKHKRALQVKERELLDREKALNEKGSSNQSQGIAADRLRSEPLKVLLENGVTYEQLTQAIMSNQENQEVHALKQELAALREGVDKRFVDNDTRAEQQVLAEMRKDAHRLASQNPDYELVRETRSVPTVMKLIHRTYRKTGEVLDVPHAMKLVEDELFKDNLKILKLNKIQSQFAPQQTQQRYTGMRTLTNRDTASVPLTAKQRAMAAFYGTYKR